MQSPSSCPSTKNGFKEGINYITSQLPQRSLTKQALKRLASALKKKSPPSSPQKSGVGSVSSQQASSTQKPKKKVTFYGMVQVRATIGLHELSLQERSATWYHKYEYFIFSSECARLVQRMRRGKTIECSRGLEYRTRKDINRRSVVDIVLDEQDRQALLGIVDDEHIAFLYHSVSSCSNRWSSLVGLQDQKEAGIANQCDESQMPVSLTCRPSPLVKPKKSIFETTSPVRRNSRQVAGLSVVRLEEEALSVSPSSPASSPQPPLNGSKAA